MFVRAVFAGVLALLAMPLSAVETLTLVPVPRPGTEAPARVDPAPETPVAEAEATDTGAAEAGEPEVATSDSEAAVLISALPGARPDGITQGFELRAALAMARNGDWDAAKQQASKDGPVAVDIIEWQRLRKGPASFADYTAFLGRNADWPGLKLLRRRGEGSLTESEDPDAVIAYFKPEPPQTGKGLLRLIKAHEAKGDFAAARKLLVTAWSSMELSPASEALFLAEYGDALAKYHVARLEDALWRKDRETARRFLSYADEDQRAVAEARLALQARSGSADKLWNAVPDKLAGDGGLARDRMEWLIAKKRRSEAGDLIIAQSTARDRLGRPEAWAERRRVLARQAMRDGSPRKAYELASTHFLDGGSAYADLEWLSGFLALRYQENPSRALTHFRHFRSEVFTPISLGRAGYWEGRALDAMGETDAARAAYADAAKYQTSFYGLLAAEKIDAPMDPEMTGGGGLEDWGATRFAQSSVFQAADLFSRAGERQQYEVTRFLRHLAETADPAELVALGDYTVDLGNPFVSVRVAKMIAQRGVVAYRSYYPLTDLGPESLPVEEALALAIARRESEFYPLAVSHVGARGLMQLMPGTARDMARKQGLPYSQGRLTSDPVYNATLGSAYLDTLINEFGNNITLVSVGYNAGPHRSRTWTDRFGDPRRSSVDVVDWIEHIPFRETRNYVMRVAESLPVYRARLTGKTAPIRLTAELQGK